METIWEVSNEDVDILGGIVYTILREGVEEATKIYPDYTDFILDFMNTDFYKHLH